MDKTVFEDRIMEFIAGIIVGFILGCYVCYKNHPELHGMAQKKKEEQVKRVG